MKRAREQGFTLPELLVALLVFAMIAAAGVYALRLGVEARDQIGAADARLAEIETARVLIREDMAQVRLRPVRDEFGAPMGPPFQGGAGASARRMAEGERLLLAFVRAGWTNPAAQAPRSSLQYVEYVEKNGALIRRARAYLDAARGQPVFERALFEDVGPARIAFLAGERSGAPGMLDWAPGWPLPGGGDGPGAPRAITLSFETSRYGELTQRFWIGDLAAGEQGET